MSLPKNNLKGNGYDDFLIDKHNRRTHACRAHYEGDKKRHQLYIMLHNRHALNRRVNKPNNVLTETNQL